MLQHNEIRIEVEVTLSPIWVSMNGNKGSHYCVVLPYHALMPYLYSSCVPHARSLRFGTTRLSQLASKSVDVSITKSLESSNANMRGHGTRESWLSWFGWLLFPPSISCLVNDCWVIQGQYEITMQRVKSCQARCEHIVYLSRTEHEPLVIVIRHHCYIIMAVCWFIYWQSIAVDCTYYTSLS